MLFFYKGKRSKDDHLILFIPMDIVVLGYIKGVQPRTSEHAQKCSYFGVSLRKT